jgi:cell division protein FtsQ
VSTVSAPADRRFRRAHVKPARTRRQWRALLWGTLRYGLAAALLVYGLHRSVGIVAHARMLQIDRIVVHGNERLSSGDVLAALSGLRGQSLIWTNLESWHHQLLSSTWIRDAELRRSLPSTVEVFISERQPVGIGRINGQLFLVDDYGVVIDEYGPQYAEFDLPIIDGLAVQAGGASTTDAARAELASRVIASLRGNQDVARRLSQVDVRDRHNAGVILAGETALIQLGEEQFLSRLQSYLELAPTLRERVSDIDYVDLRFDGRIYVRPADRTLKAVHITRPRR